MNQKHERNIYQAKANVDLMVQIEFNSKVEQI